MFDFLCKKCCWWTRVRESVLMEKMEIWFLHVHFVHFVHFDRKNWNIAGRGGCVITRRDRTCARPVFLRLFLWVFAFFTTRRYRYNMYRNPHQNLLIKWGKYRYIMKYMIYNLNHIYIYLCKGIYIYIYMYMYC